MRWLSGWRCLACKPDDVSSPWAACKCGRWKPNAQRFPLSSTHMLWPMCPFPLLLLPPHFKAQKRNTRHGTGSMAYSPRRGKQSPQWEGQTMAAGKPHFSGEIPNTMRIIIRLIGFGSILVKSNFPLACMHHLYKRFLYLIYACVPTCMFVHYTSARTFGGQKKVSEPWTWSYRWLWTTMRVVSRSWAWVLFSSSAGFLPLSHLSSSLLSFY